MFLKKLFSDSLIYAVGPQIPKVAGVFVLPLITRYLSDIDYGVYGIITSYISIFSALSDLGLSIVLVNSFYKHPLRWKLIWKQIHFYLMLWSVVMGFVICLLLYFIIPVDAAANLISISLLVCIPTAFFSSTTIIGSRYYQFAQKPIFIAVTSSIVGVIAIVLNLYTIVWLKMGYMGWFYSTAISTFIQFLLFIYPVFYKYGLGPIFSFRKKFLKSHLRVSLPLIPHNYSGYLLNSSDRIVMDRMRVSVGKIGEYNLAYTFGNYFDFFGNAVGMAIGPFYTRMMAKNSALQNKSLFFITNWLQVSFIIVGFLLSLWTKELLDLLISNEGLKKVYPLAIILIMGYVYKPYYWIAITRLQFEEKTSELWKISFIAGILNIILNIIFIPIFGIMAAAISTFIALIYMGFSGFYIKTYREVETVKYYPFIFVSIIIGLTITVFFLKDMNLRFKGLISLLVLGSYFSYYLSKKMSFKMLNEAI